MKNGIVYIAFIRNKKADRVKELKHSAKSIKKIHPNLPITLFTDVDPNITEIDEVVIINVTGERIKQEYLERSPYDRTLYLDSDTEAVGNIDSIFKLLDRFDISACIDHVRKDSKTSSVWKAYNDIPDGFSEYAGGVILFRKTEPVFEFFNIWRTRYREWCALSGRFNDQPSFRVSLYETENLHIHTLLPEYNIRSKKYHNIVPRIYHNHSLYTGLGNTRGGNIWM